jgi:hypothetical protein
MELFALIGFIAGVIIISYLCGFWDGKRRK